MSTMIIPAENMKNGFTIVTQVISAQNNQTGLGSITRISALEPLGKFLKGEPKALGTVQIMIGVMSLLFGTVITVNTTGAVVFSGILYWGGLVVIVTGGLTVKAGNKLDMCLMKASILMNVISALTAATACLILSLELVGISLEPCKPGTSCWTTGTDAVLLVFAVLQLIISITLSAYGCKATSINQTLELGLAMNSDVSIPVSSLDTSHLCSNVEDPPGERPPAYTENENRT